MFADWRGFDVFSFGMYGPAGNWLGLAMFVALSLYVIWDASRAKEEEGAGPEISM